MGTTITPHLNTNGPVLPGTVVTKPVYTDIGFTAGDYVYQYSSGSVGPFPSIGTAYLLNITLPIGGGDVSNGYGPISISRSSITAPQSTTATTASFSGTSSSLGSNFQASTLIQNTASGAYNGNYGIAAATLKNGNIVYLFTSNTNTALYYQIMSPTGTAVANGTITSTFTTTNGARGYDVCALFSGGFAVCWSSGTTLVTATYDATGAVARAAVTCTAVTNRYFYRIAANGSDALFVSGVDSTGNTPGGASGSTIIYAITSAATGFDASYSINVNYDSCMAAAFSISNNGNICYVSASAGSNYYFCGTCSYNSTTKTFTTISGNSVNTIYNSAPAQTEIPKPAPLYNGGFLAIVPSTSSVSSCYIAYFNSVGTYVASNAGLSNGLGSAPTVWGIVPYYGASSATSTAYAANSNSALVYMTSSSSSINVYQIYTNGTSIFLGAAVATSIPLQTNPFGYAFVPTFTGGTIAAYLKSTDNKPYFVSSGTFTFTNGTSYSIPSQYVYANQSYGTYLIGVAATTASAGSYGDVFVNGVAQLASTYATSSSVIGFNYSTLNSPNLFSNRGYVVNRTVTLQGLE